MVTRLGAGLRLPDGRTDWSRVAAAFLRAMAVLWLFASVVVWAEIVGAIGAGPTGDEGATIADAGTPERLRAGLFAIMYPVAAVGLWLGASWGVVIFVLSILAQIAIAVAFSATFGIDPLMIAANLACLVAWATLAVQVRRNPVVDKKIGGAPGPERVRRRERAGGAT